MGPLPQGGPTNLRLPAKNLILKKEKKIVHLSGRRIHRKKVVAEFFPITNNILVMEERVKHEMYDGWYERKRSAVGDYD